MEPPSVSFSSSTFGGQLHVLQKVGNGYFGVTDAKVDADPSHAGVTVAQRQGREFQRGSGRNPRFVWSVSRGEQFEMLQKAISITTDMNKKAVEDVARVGSGGLMAEKNI